MTIRECPGMGRNWLPLYPLPRSKTYVVYQKLVAQFLGIAKFGARDRADAEAGVTGTVTFGRDPSSRWAGVLPLARE